MTCFVQPTVWTAKTLCSLSYKKKKSSKFGVFRSWKTEMFCNSVLTPLTTTRTTTKHFKKLIKVNLGITNSTFGLPTDSKTHTDTLNGKRKQNSMCIQWYTLNLHGWWKQSSNCRQGFVHIKSDRQMSGEQSRHCALPLCEGTFAVNTLWRALTPAATN